MEFEINPNENGRYYSPEVLRKAVADVQEKVKARQMLGEFEFLGAGRTRVSHVSHVVTDMRVNDDGSIIADFEFLDTPAGKAAKDDILLGAPMYVTTKDISDVDENGVVSNYKIVGVPIISGPKPWESIVDRLGRLADKKPDGDEIDD